MSGDLIDEKLLAALDQGQVIVTSQRTQARYLRYAFARHKKLNDVSAWPTPQILTWDDWILYLAREIMWSGYVSSAGQRKLLNPGQEQLIWEQVIAQHTDDALIDNLGGTAARARQAWGLIQCWRLPDPKTAQFPNRDVHTFSRWMKTYFARTAQHNWLDQARLPDSVSPAIRAGAIAPPRELVLFGFDSFTPQQRVLLKTLENLGAHFQLVKQKKSKGELSRVGFGNQETELNAAARWVRMILANEQPGLTAVLIPELDRKLDQVFRIFDDVLSPGSALPTSSLTGRPYTISIEAPFVRHKFVQGAFSILRYSLLSSFFPDVSTFLRSPYTRASGAEQPMRARFELWLRQNNIDSVYPGELEALLELFAQRHDTDAGNSVLSAILRALKAPIAKAQGQHSAAFWAAAFRDILNITGWPGDIGLNIVERQAVEKFKELLNELAALDFLVPVCSASQALAHLNRIVRGSSFRPMLPETPVQIMQPEQAYGLRFDHAWVAGWHSQNWPEAASPNPFLPIEWQRQYQIPGSSGELQLQRAIALTEDLCGAAGEVVFSHPLASDEEELSESPLIQNVPADLRDSVEIADVTDYCEVIRAATDLVDFTDNDGPAFSDTHFAKGGSSIFKLQSQCPFKAFAQLRLGAKPWNVPRPGVNAIDRGNHLHKALEFVWVKIGNSETLAEVFSTEHLENQVYREVELALNYQERKRIRRYSAELRNLEQRRLVRQILEILAMEVKRPAFEVDGHEVPHKVHIGGITVDIRIDRVDHVFDKGLMLIDYKLGERTANMWKQPRMEEPQLPLYAQAYEQPVAALAFLNGKAGAIGMHGLGNAHDIAPGVQIFEVSSFGKQLGISWTEQLAAWKAELEAIAGRYIQGDARVDPASVNTCKHCDLKSLCRIGERRLREGKDHV